MTPTQRLVALGITLPPPAPPVASYIPARRAGAQVFVSGQIPFVNGTLMMTGRVPERVSLEQARACARQCALNGLAAAAAVAGGLDRLTGVVRVGCFVACGPEFTDHAKVANGASDLMLELFGESGRHARASVGCASLPLDAPVEVEFLFEVG